MESDTDSLVYPQRFLSTSHPASPSSTHEAFRSFHHLCSYTVSFQDLVCKRGGAKPFRAVFSLRDINDDSPEAEAEAGLGVGLGLHNIDINSGDEQEEKLRINDSIRSNNRISIEGKVYAHKAFSNTYNHYSKGRYGTTIVDQELAFVIYGYVKGIKKDVVMMNVSKVQAGSNASALNPIKGKHVNAYPSYALSTGANYIISFYGSSHYHSRQQHNTSIRYLHTMTDMEALQVMIAPQIRGQLPTTPTHAAIPMVKQEPIEEEPITPRSTRRSHVRSASSPLVFTGTSSAVTSVLASASLASAAVSTSQSVSVSCGLGLSVNVNAPMCSSPISGHHSRSHSYDADSPRAKRSSSKRRYDQPTTTSATTTSTSPSTDGCNMATTPRQHQSQHPINPHNALGSTSPTSAAAPTPTSAPSSHPQLRLSHSSSSLPHAMSLLQQQRPLQLGIGNKAVEDALHKRRRRHSKMHPSAPVAANPHIHIPTAAQHHHHHHQQPHHHHDASTVLNSPASYLSSSFRGLNLNVPTTFSLGSPNASHKSSVSPSRTSALTISLASASLAKYINSNEYHETTPHSGSSSIVSSPRESRSGSFSTYHEYSSMASSTNMDNDDVDSVYTEDDTLSSFSTASPSSVDELDQHATSWPEVTTNFTINLKGLDKIAHEPTRSDYQDPILSSLPSVSTSMPPPTSMDTSSSSDYGYGYGYGYAGTAIRTQHGGMDPLAYHNHSSALLFDRYNEEFSC